MHKRLVVWFKDVDKNDVELVGDKGAQLGEMVKEGFPVPKGFIITTKAYYQFLEENNLKNKIHHLLNATQFNNTTSLNKTGKLIKKYIVQGNLSAELVGEVFRAYTKLGGLLEQPVVAIMSSATAETVSEASFTSPQKTYLHVQGEANVLLKIKEAWASLFDAHALLYRHDKHIDHFKVGIALPIQKMVESEKSGIIFSSNPITNDKRNVVIEAMYGQVFNIQGTITRDHYEVDKSTHAILNKKIAEQKIMFQKVGSHMKKIQIPVLKRNVQKITYEQILELAKIASKLEKHYYFPQEISWAIEKNTIYIVQTRPITSVTIVNKTKLDEKSFDLTTFQLPILLSGAPASPGIASGSVRIVKNAKELGKITHGDILVAPETNSDFVFAMKKARAIITDKGNNASHAAIASREIGIPAIVGTQKGTSVLQNGMMITVNGSKGEIFKGSYHIQTETNEHVGVHKKTATKVYVNVAEPEFAEKISSQNVDGVGLLRAEYMMANIAVHPKKMIQDGKKKEYIHKLAEDLEKFCRVFTPRPVIYRTSDFQTSEYRNLVGGKSFEPIESNPLLGFRGAFRYMHNSEVFDMELEAIKLVRNKMGLKNLWLMIPFVRTVEELVEVKKLISAAGLYRTPTFKLWMMVELPSNVVLLDQFIKVGIDGVSIGANNLTMLMLGIDRDNHEISQEYNEQNEALVWAYEHVIKTAQKHNITSSICGQASSLYPNLLEKLIQWGITSVSVSPNAIENTRELISQFEKKLIL